MDNCTKLFRKSLKTASERAKLYFDYRAEKRVRTDWDIKGALKDLKKGSVYVYFDARNRALYIGQTGGGVKQRVHFVTSDHRKTTWWKKWKYLYFLPCLNCTDRLTLELL